MVTRSFGLPLLLGLLSGCCGPPNEPFASLGLEPTIQAQIEGWNLDEGYTVSAYISGQDLKTAAIAADGSFLVPLPDVAALAPYINTWTSIRGEDCSQVCPSDLKGASAFFEVKKGNAVVGNLRYSVPVIGQQDIIFEYADQPGDRIGHCQSSGHHDHFQTDIQVNYQVGWNVVIHSSHVDGSIGTLFWNEYSAFAPAGTKWSFVPLPSG